MDNNLYGIAFDDATSCPDMPTVMGAFLLFAAVMFPVSIWFDWI